MAVIEEDDLVNLVGTIAWQEFQGAREVYKDELLNWVERVQRADDTEFTSIAASAIATSALVQRFRGNWEHDHFKASTAYYMATVRHRAAGHTKECRGSTLYSYAYNRAVREAGHPGMAHTEPCTCGKVDVQ